MPEIAEVARVVHQIHKRLVGTTIKQVIAQDDACIFGKVGTSAVEFQKALIGKKIISAGQQGKYFWLTMSSPPHPLLHFGMSGWLHIRGEEKLYYKSQKYSDKEKIKEEHLNEEWPPSYWKFKLETTDVKNRKPNVEAAFADARRFSRVRLLSCDKEDIRKVSPLKENGPDPVIDKHILSLDWLIDKIKKKHVPIKSFLLNQANISGIGNWVGDEILYNAKIHPEQYTDTLSIIQIEKIHESIIYICETAVSALVDSEEFPPDWLFNHRWGKAKFGRVMKKLKKGNKNEDEEEDNAATKLPNGQMIDFITVDGRTSCIVPSVQRNSPAHAHSNDKIEKGEREEDRELDQIQAKKQRCIHRTGNDDAKNIKRVSEKKRVTKRPKREVDLMMLDKGTRKSPRFHSNSSEIPTRHSS